MNKNVKIAKELIRIAKNLVAEINVTVDSNGKSDYELSDRYWDLPDDNAQPDKGSKENKKRLSS